VAIWLSSAASRCRCAILFRDPDANLVNFYTPVTPEAIARFSGR